jgi:hypothetical protein
VPFQNLNDHLWGGHHQIFDVWPPLHPPVLKIREEASRNKFLPGEPTSATDLAPAVGGAQ